MKKLLLISDDFTWIDLLEIVEGLREYEENLREVKFDNIWLLILRPKSEIPPSILYH